MSAADDKINAMTDKLVNSILKDLGLSTETYTKPTACTSPIVGPDDRGAGIHWQVNGYTSDVTLKAADGHEAFQEQMEMILEGLFEAGLKCGMAMMTTGKKETGVVSYKSDSGSTVVVSVDVVA